MRISGQRFALYLSDSVEFPSALFGAWAAGKMVYLPGDTLPATCAHLRQTVHGYLGEFTSQWDPMIPTPQDEKPRGDALVEDEVKQLIIDVVQLEDITPADIDTDAPLFVGWTWIRLHRCARTGVALHKRYGISLSGDAVRRHHRCVFAYVI